MGVRFWSGGVKWHEENKFEEFLKNKYWKIGWEKSENTKGAKQAWDNINQVQVGDYLSFHSHGGRNDLRIYLISRITGKIEEQGILYIEPIQKENLFHDKAPKLDTGTWFGTLLEVTGEIAISAIFGDELYQNFAPNSSENKINHYTNLLTHTHNLILHGAPGTGKTFLAKEIAKAMNAEVGFIQFHPSYDYTDFVEGLRPIYQDDAYQIGFELKDGVFKSFCSKALQNLTDSCKTQAELQTEINLKETYEDFIGKVRNEEINEILQKRNSPLEIIKVSDNDNLILKKKDSLSSVTYTVSFNRLEKLSKAFPTQKSLDEIQNIDHEIRQAIGGCHSSAYWATLSYLYKNMDKIQTTPPVKTDHQLKPFIFIIDEINRGDLSKIFGELFYAIDPGYRVTGDDLKANKEGKTKLTTIRTQYANMEKDGNSFDYALNISQQNNFGHFFVPENIYIIGTMNDIDRSVETMDFAFRRRFTFAEITASEQTGMLEKIQDVSVKQKALNKMKAVNAIISETEGLSSAYHIGGAYFLKLETLDGDFTKLWNYHLAPLIKEYLRGTEDEKGTFEKIKTAYENA